jgi:hypothetical protein
MDLARLGTYSSITEAELVRARLAAYDIAALVQADNLGGAMPTMALTERIKVFVREADLADAYEVLERMLPSGDQDAGDHSL